jgi:MFS family permease
MGSATPVWAVFRHRTFAIIWLATVASNIGAWMYNVASGWLMLSLDSDPFVVSMVQVANSLPMFFFAIPAGALVDIVDSRRFLLLGELAITLLSVLFAILVSRHLVGPANLLALSFLLAVGDALTAPAWQAVVTQLVAKSELSSAIASNSVGINVSRAIGPALGGFIIAAYGLAAPFWIDAFSNVGVIAALIWWRPVQPAGPRLPPESFGNAVVTGLRHARYNPYLRATLIQAAGFFTVASAYWALLPLVVNRQMHGGPTLYGAMLACVGISAVGGAVFLKRLRGAWGADRLLRAATLVTAAATGILAMAAGPMLAVIASLLVGASWIAAVSTLNVSAQLALPDWVRGRGLAMYVTVMFGALTAGSAVWGELATLGGLRVSLFVAAVAAVLVVPVSLRWKLQADSGIDLSPSMHWPAPIALHPVAPERGPVVVTIEYRIKPSSRDPFLLALSRYANERMRDGGYDWAVFEDPADDGRFLETFRADSWLEHLRQHARVTNTDRTSETAVLAFHIGERPKATHWVTAGHERAESMTGTAPSNISPTKQETVS